MELIIRRRSNGLYVLLSLFGAMVTSVQTEDRHSARQLVIVRLSLHLTHISSSFSFSMEQSIRFYPTVVFADSARGPPELDRRAFYKAFQWNELKI